MLVEGSRRRRGRESEEGNGKRIRSDQAALLVQDPGSSGRCETNVDQSETSGPVSKTSVTDLECEHR